MEKGPVIDDPFRPPGASLDVPEAARGTKPATVKYAVWLVWLSMFIASVLTVLRWSMLEFANPAGDAVVLVLSLLVFWFLAYKLSAGRNWARWVLAVLWGLGALGMAASFALMPQVWQIQPGLLVTGSVLQTALQLVILVMLFSRDAGPWFRPAR